MLWCGVVFVWFPEKIENISLCRVSADGIYQPHGNLNHGGPLRVPHPQGRPLGHLQRQQGGHLRVSPQGSRLPVPLQESASLMTRTLPTQALEDRRHGLKQRGTKPVSLSFVHGLSSQRFSPARSFYCFMFFPPGRTRRPSSCFVQMGSRSPHL